MTTYTVTKTLIRHEDFSTSQAPETRFNECLTDFVQSGCLFATSASLTGTISAGVSYVNGKRVAVAEATHLFTASKDTYVDLSDDGTLNYTAVSNGAGVPDLVANAIRLCKVVTSGAAITSVTDARNLWSALEQVEREICAYVAPQQYQIDLGSFAGGSEIEIPFFICPTDGVLTDGEYISWNTVTANVTNYCTLRLYDKGASGTDNNLLCSVATSSTTLTAMDAVSVGNISTTYHDLHAGDVLSFKYSPTALGPVEGILYLHLRFTFCPETPIFVAPHQLTLRKIYAVPNKSVAQNATYYVNLTIYDKGSAGTGTDVVGYFENYAYALTKFDKHDITALANTGLAKGDVLSAQISCPGGGQPTEGIPNFHIFIQYTFDAEVKDDRT